MMDVLAGFIVGIVGSLHCVGMCGPLVLALPLTKTDRVVIALQSSIYNLGRVFVYGLLGFLLGLLGWFIEISGFQKGFSILLGSIMVITSLNSVTSVLKIKPVGFSHKLSKFCGLFIKKLFTVSSRISAFRVGMINGFLPCGLVYVALATSVTLGSPWKSSIYMFLFGLGTMPLMLAVMIGGKMFKGMATKLRVLLPVFTILLGVYLIVRGLNLQITLNPEDLLNQLEITICH